MATPIYLPNAARALPRPRVYAPQSNTGTAAMAGGLSALSQVAEIWRDKKNFEQQAEQMAQTLEREGMTEQANLYRGAAQNAAVNFFSDPATNRKAQQGLLSDALKLLQQKQENDLRREIAQSQIDAGIASDERRETFYTERDRINYERDLERDRLKAEQEANDPLAQERADTARANAEVARENAVTSRNRLRLAEQARADAITKSQQFEQEMEAERKKGFTVTPFTRDGIITGYSVKDMRNREIRRRGVEIISDPATGEPILKTESNTTTTTVPQGSTGITPEAPGSVYNPAASGLPVSDGSLPAMEGGTVLPDLGLIE